MRRNGGADGLVGSGATRGDMDGVDAIEESKISGAGFRLALAHLKETSKQLQMADVIQAAEEQGATAFKAVSHQ